MPKSISVQFEDGTSHTYDNVPDDVTQEQIDARTKMDYPDRTVAEVAEGAHPEAPAVAPREKEQDLATQALGYGKATLDTAIEHPGVVAGAAGLYKASQLANAYKEKARIDSIIKGQEMVSKMVKPNFTTEAGQQMYRDALQRAGVPATLEKPPGIMQRAATGISNMAQRGMQTLSNLGSSGVTPPMPEAPPSNANYMQRMTQLADRYLPAAANAARIGGVGLAGMLPATLNSNEDQLLAQKHALEQAQLLNKQRTEVNSKQKQPQ